MMARTRWVTARQSGIVGWRRLALLVCAAWVAGLAIAATLVVLDPPHSRPHPFHAGADAGAGAATEEAVSGTGIPSGRDAGLIAGRRWQLVVAPREVA